MILRIGIFWRRSSEGIILLTSAIGLCWPDRPYQDFGCSPRWAQTEFDTKQALGQTIPRTLQAFMIQPGSVY